MGKTAAELIRRRPLVLLFLLCLIAWLPGFFTIPALDRDESRFAQASKQMLETGDLVDIRFGVEPRYKKPVGIYWLQAAATEAVSVATGDHARNHIWTYRIPSLLGALVAVALAYWCATAFLSVEASFLGALLLGLTLLLSSEAKIAKTDAVLLATILGAQGVLLRAYLSRDPAHPAPGFRLAMLGWLSFAFGILDKGPVIVGVCGATVAVLAVWERDWRWLGRLRPLWGIALTLLVVAPWLVAIALKSHGAFYQQSLGHDFGAKLAGGEESHGLPPGYYLLATTLTFWPATLFLVPAIAAAIVNHRQPGARFLLAWVASWPVFEIVPTKLPHYILPLYPALAMMAAAFVLAPREAGLPAWRGRIMPIFSCLHYLLGAALLAAAIVYLPIIYGSGTSWDLMAAAGLVAVLALAAVLAVWRDAKPAAVTFAAAGAIATLWAATLDVLPRLEQLMVSPREAAMIAAHLKPGDPPPVLAGYTEPSAMFLIGTATRLTDGYGAAEIGAAQGGLAAVEDGQRPRFLAHLAEMEADATPVDSLSGFNYSRGRPVHITLFRVTPPHEITTPPPE